MSVSTDEMLDTVKQWGLGQNPHNPIVRMSVEYLDGDKATMRMPLNPPPHAPRQEPTATVSERFHPMEDAIIEILSQQTKRIRSTELADLATAKTRLSVGMYYTYRKTLVERGLIDVVDGGYALAGGV